MKRLMTYDRDNMKPEVVEHGSTFTSDPDFDPEVVAKKGSVAAAGLARWVHAMIKYDKVAKNVAPKRAALKGSTSHLERSHSSIE